MKKMLLFLLAIGMCFSLFSFASWYLTDGFSTANISSELPFTPRWEVADPPQEEISKLLEQNFYYIGRGSQCYVFEGEDKQTVLKFFRQNRFRCPKITRYFTAPSFLKEIQNRKREAKHMKLEALFESCKIAYEDLREETGVLYLHLNKTCRLDQEIVIYDKLKRAHRIHCDDYAFMLQKHGEHIFSYITRLLNQGKKEEAKEALANLVTLLSSRLNKGIADHDAVVHKNAGFRGKKALFLDIGEFSKEPCHDTQQELWQLTAELRKWLCKQDPDLASTFESSIKTYSQNGEMFQLK